MTPLFAFGMPGMPELLLIFVIVFVLFGAKRLPELAKGLGSSMKEFKKARDEFQSEIHRSADEPEKASLAVQPSVETPTKPV